VSPWACENGLFAIGTRPVNKAIVPDQGPSQPDLFLRHILGQAKKGFDSMVATVSLKTSVEFESWQKVHQL
jgi:hypothetical protein